MKKLILIVLVVGMSISSIALAEKFSISDVSLVYSNGKDVIYVPDLEDKQKINLTEYFEENAIFPAISPDGKLVAFTTDNGEMLPNQLYLMDVMSKKIIGVSNFPDICHSSPSFSPDSKKVVCSIYSKQKGGGMAIYDIVAIKDGEILPRDYHLTPKTSHNRYPIWSQDGTQIMNIERPTKGSLAGKCILGLCDAPNRYLCSGVLFPGEIEAGLVSWSPSDTILFVKSGKIYSGLPGSKKQKKLISGASPRWISEDIFLFRNKKGELFLHYNSKKKEKILEKVPEWYSVTIQ